MVSSILACCLGWLSVLLQMACPGRHWRSPLPLHVLFVEDVLFRSYCLPMLWIHVTNRYWFCLAFQLGCCCMGCVCRLCWFCPNGILPVLVRIGRYRLLRLLAQPQSRFVARTFNRESASLFARTIESARCLSSSEIELIWVGRTQDDMTARAIRIWIVIFFIRSRY